MAKNHALNPLEQVAVGCGVLAAANWLSGHYLGFPFAYCWLAPIMAPIYLAWGVVALSILVLYGGFHLLRGRTFEAILAALAFVLIIELPHLTVVVFLPEGSCAG